jgi:hypothetical protein
MTWVWVALAWVLGIFGGISFGHRARVVAYMEGYKNGLKAGWQDAKWDSANPDPDFGPPYNPPTGKVD